MRRLKASQHEIASITGVKLYKLRFITNICRITFATMTSATLALRVISLVVVFLMSSCGGGGGGGGVSTPASPGTPGVAFLVDDPIEGVEYTCGTSSGMTGSDGSFNYDYQSTCKFKVGGLVLGNGINIASDGLVTPYELAGLTTRDQTSDSVASIARVLQSLGDSNSPTGRIRISESARTSLSAHQEFSLLNSDGSAKTDSQLLTIANLAGKSLVSREVAEQKLSSGMLAACGYTVSAPSSIFYEITGTDIIQRVECAYKVAVASNVKSAISVNDTLGVADGAWGGGDGGGGGGDGGGGGGGGGGDLWIRRVSNTLKDFFYSFTGISDSYATTTSACGNGIQQSDFNRLLSTGVWKYESLVNAGIKAGTVCVNKIFDANKYVVVSASGLTKNGSVCSLLFINKSSGETKCFGTNLKSGIQLNNLGWGVDISATKDKLTTTSWLNSSPVALSNNGRYLSLAFGESFFVRFVVDDPTSLTHEIMLQEGDISTPLGSYLNIKLYTILNNGSIVVHYTNDKTYLLSTPRSPNLINDRIYTNPQCIMPSKLSSDGFLFVAAKDAGYYLYGYSSGAFQLASTKAFCGALDNYSAMTSAGKFYYAYRTYTTDQNGRTPTAIKVCYVNLGSTPNTEVCPINVNPPSNNLADGLENVGVYISNDDSKLILVTRSDTTIDAARNVISGGKSRIGVYSITNHTLLNETLPFSANQIVRRFDQGSSGNFAYITEPYTKGNSGYSQNAIIRNNNFSTEVISSSRPGQNIKSAFYPF